MLHPLQGTLHRWLPWLFAEGGDITLGPIPAGVPVDLLANLQPLPEGANPVAHTKEVVGLLALMKRDLGSVPANASDEELRKHFADLRAPLMKLSKCPDFIVNRGHYFGTSYFKEEPALSDADKKALIEFLKTF
jgi:hypothetical protein